MINEADDCEAEVTADSVEEERHHRQERWQQILATSGPLGGPQLCSAPSAYTEISCESGLREGGERRREERGGVERHKTQQNTLRPRKILRMPPPSRPQFP